MNRGSEFCRLVPYHLAMAPYSGAGNGAQTRDLCLGKAALYQLSYSRIKVSINTISKIGNKVKIKPRIFLFSFLYLCR